MESVSLKYRLWYQCEPPKPIKLQIPGWSGEANEHTDGDRPQPWHCVPFVEGATYGLELCYAFDTEARVTLQGDEIKVSGDFTEENKRVPNVPLPPFSSFAPGHFGMTSCMDIKVPEGYVLRLEPHPRFYTDETDTVPCAIPGHLATNWWGKIFFVVFKNPRKGQEIIFRKGEPYAQILVIPKKMAYTLEPMPLNEQQARTMFDEVVGGCARHIATNSWKDHRGKSFDDKYKVLNNISVKHGTEGVLRHVDRVRSQTHGKQGSKSIRLRLINRKAVVKDETIQDSEK